MGDFMNLKKNMLCLGLLVIGITRQVYGAQDSLMMPTVARGPLSVQERVASIASPSDEAKAVVDQFTDFQLGQFNKVVHDDTAILSGQERYRNSALYYMNVRRSWYIDSHNYKTNSYASQALNAMYDDYKTYLNKHLLVTDYNQADYKEGLLAILDKHTATVYDDELRSYLNEMVIFSFRQAMDDTNRLVTVKEGPNAHMVNLRKIINQ